MEEETPKLSRLDSSKKIEDEPLKQSARLDPSLPPVIENTASSGIFLENSWYNVDDKYSHSSAPGHELEHLSELGKLIVRTIQGVETGDFHSLY